MGNEHSGKRDKDRSIRPNDPRLARKTMALSKATASDLELIGIRPEIAKKLVEDKEKGKLKCLSDVVAALEKSGARCQVKFENNFKVEIDEKGEVELRVRKKREDEQEHEKLKKEKWTSQWSLDEDSKPTAAKRKGLQTSPQGKKRRKAVEDEDCNAADKEWEEEEWEEEEGKLNVNIASEEELDEIQGIGPSLARKIVKYREENGDFRRLQDLAAIRGISRRRVKELDEVLTVGEILQEGPGFTKLNPVPTNGCLQYEGQEVVRIMSWNLQCFNDDKAANRGVLEVICRTILENG